MFYRGATIVVCLLAIALALQLIAVLTVPVTTSITLCTYDGYQFGVFGFCNNNGTCSPVQIGYSSTTVEELAVFSLPSNTRHSISKLLVVHPISAGFTLILLICSSVIHFNAPAKNLRFLFFLLLWTLPTFLLSLLSFLVDILLFAPHLDWSGWIILGSTVLIAICGAMLCIMRRSTSSRLAMDQNNRLMNNQNNRYSMNGFDYDEQSGISPHSSDNLLNIKSSMEDFVGGDNFGAAIPPDNYLNVSNNAVRTRSNTGANTNDILTVTETISNHSNVPKTTQEYEMTNQSNPRHLLQLLPSAEDRRYFGSSYNPQQATPYNGPTDNSNNENINSNNSINDVLHAINESNEQTTARTPYPLQSDFDRNSLSLPSERTRKDDKLTLDNLPFPIIRLNHQINEDSLKTRRLNKIKENIQHNDFQRPIISNKPTDGIAQINYGTSTSESDFSGEDINSKLSNGIDSDLVISEIISSGEALEIQLPNRNSLAANLNRYIDRDPQLRPFDNSKTRNSVFTTDNAGHDQLSILNVSPTLPLTPHKTGFS